MHNNNRATFKLETKFSKDNRLYTYFITIAKINSITVQFVVDNYYTNLIK